jgi:putative ABC transport system permease protein
MSPLAELSLATRLVRRDARAGELRVLFAALAVAVAAITAVAFFTDRVRVALLEQAGELLGADLVISAPDPLPASLRRAAAAAGLRSVEAVSFPSMVLGEGGGELATVKAVGQGFPLRGAVRIAQRLYAPGEPAAGVPAPGTVWMEPRLAGGLGVSRGDRVRLGDSTLTVAGFITAEPGRAGELFSIAPTLLLNLDDLPATGLVQPASRVSHRLLLSGPLGSVEAFRAEQGADLPPGARVQGLRDARPEMRAALDRAQRFLGLAALTSLLLAAAAVAVTARRFARRHLDHCAVMRCLGATQGTIVRLYMGQVVLIGLAAGVAGSALGFAAHLLLARALGDLLGLSLPAPTLRPLGAGVVTALATLLGFAAPALLQLRNVPALRVLRRELGGLRAPGAIAYVAGAAVLAGLIVWQARDLRLGAYLVAGTAAALLVLTLGALALVWAVRGLRARRGAAAILGLGNLVRRPGHSVLQIASFGLGVMALLLLSVVRDDLLRDWRATLPPDAPNRFVINIQPDQTGPVREFLAAEGVGSPTLYPMVRARLEAINGDAVAPEDFEEGRARRLATREFNLSWAERLAPDNRIVAGRWWRQGDEGKALLSVEEGIAETLGIRLGDELTYAVAGERFTARVVSLRSVEWDSFKPNFFVLAAPGLLDAYPATFITAFYLSPQRFPVLDRLVARFPNATVIDVAAIMDQVKTVIERVSAAVEYVFLLTLLAGVTVLYAAIQASHDERMAEAALVRTLGGRRRQLLRAMAVEFAVLGGMAGLLAAVLANVVAWVLASQVLDLPFSPRLMLVVWGALGGAVGVTAAGLLGTRSVLRQPPLAALRRAFG